MTNKRMAKTTFIAAMVLLAAAVSALAWTIGAPGRQRERTQRDRDKDRDHPTETETRSFAVNGIPDVKLETFDGSVSVRGWDKSEVAVTAIKMGRTAEALQTIRLRIEQHGSEVAAIAESDRSGYDHRDWTNVRFEVTVPREANLRVSSGDGSLQVDGVEGRMDLKTGDGSVRAERVAGEMEVKTGDGSITVSEGRGRLHVSTGDGRIDILKFNGEAEAYTNDGRITLDGSFTGLKARTGDGSITLGLPADFNATVETTSPSIIVQGLSATEETYSTDLIRRWRIGNGGNLLSLKTGDGRIIVRRAVQ